MAGVELRDYQEEAVRRMQNGCILCGGVGSGKSRTSLAYYYVRNGGELGTDEYVPMDDTTIKDLYIITTARKRDTFEWEEELSPFLLSTDKEENLYTNKVVIDSWNNIKKYADIKDAFFIFDEQRVIGAGTWVKAFLKIAKVMSGYCYLQHLAIPGRIIFQCLWLMDFIKTEANLQGSI